MNVLDIEWDSIVERLTADDSADDDVVHIVCCNPDRALCGIDLNGENWVGDDDESEECEDCARLADDAWRSCGVPFCRIRQAWRGWRS